MSYSQAEILALMTKAARGAGAPPGQASRFGQAAVAHLVAGRDAAELVTALAALPDGPILRHPRVIDAALSMAENHIASIEADTSDALFASYMAALPFDVEASESRGRSFFSIKCTTPAAKATVTRIALSDYLVEKLKAYAKETLVPDSDVSRSAGAGAGLDDND